MDFEISQSYFTKYHKKHRTQKASVHQVIMITSDGFINPDIFNVEISFSADLPPKYGESI